MGGGFIEYLQHYPSYGEPPYPCKKSPPPYPMKYPKREWHVCASDKKKDCRMLNDAKHTLGLAYWQCVVDGGCKVKEYDCRGEETRTDKESNVSGPCGMGDEKRSSDECGDQPYTMANAVGNFLRWRLLSLEPCRRHDENSA